MIRTEVYRAIDRERDYQDKHWPGQSKEVGEYLTMLRSYLRIAESDWTFNKGDRLALDGIRKIAGIAVRCMEDHGVQERVEI